MNASESETSAWIRSARLLWCAKFAAVVLSLLFTIPNLPFVGDYELNFVSATFYIALIGLIPRFGWTIPCMILGFWLTPMLFAFRVNGSFAEDLTTAIIGGTIGLIVGVILDVQNHLTKSTPTKPEPNPIMKSVSKPIEQCHNDRTIKI